jgi:uncharacterized cupredoxin-like copper-binding protein
MARRAAIGAAAVVVAAVAAAPVTAAPPTRRHRVSRPPAAAPPLARTLTVDESEWALRPSKRVVAAGEVKLHVYNRGEDDHNLVIVDGAGSAHVVLLKPGTDGVLTPRLAPGRYRIICSLQAGTPESHEGKGMWFTLDAR